MWGRSAGPGSTRRSRRPGHRSFRPSIASSTVAASTSSWRGRPGKSGGSEAELRRQALGDLRPRLATVVAAVHADVVLLVHAYEVGGRSDFVDAEADLLVVGRPIPAEPLVARRPCLPAVGGFEKAVAL